MKDRVLSVLGVQSRRVSSGRAMDYLQSELYQKASEESFDLLIMPEKWIAEPIKEGSDELLSILSFFKALSLEKKAIIVPGSFSIVRDGKLYNTSPVIDSGTLLGWQDKISLFMDENGNYERGREVRSFRTSLLTLSVAVCYDADFPYFSKMAAYKGAEIIVNPSLIHSDFHDMWHIYIRGRSLENRLPFISINSISEPFKGNSILTIPKKHQWGVKLDEILPGKQPFVSAEIDLKGLSELIKNRANEDPGHYSLNSDKLV